MGRNRRQQRLRERRTRDAEQNAPAEQTPRPTGGGGASRGGGGGHKPAWRETIDSWGGFTVIGAIVAAVLVGGLLVFLNRPGASENTEAYVPRERDVQVNGTVMGDPNAPVRIIEYADFQCPFCKNFWNLREPAIVEEYVETGQASFEFRNYAFIGPESQQAAEAAACAADQNRFWEYHDLLFLRQGRENSGVFSDGNLKEYAETIGDTFEDFDVGEWESCFEADTYEADIIEQNRVASNSGITSTPTLLINGQMVAGVQSLETYRNAIDAALENSGQ